MPVRETGLYYLQSRYYNPSWGRFLNADAFVATGQGLLGNNMFAYCRSNPVIRKDATGTDDICVTTQESDENPMNDLATIGGRGGGGGGGGGTNGGNYTGGSYDGSFAGANSGHGISESNFRSNLQEFTGENGAGQHAHHVYPKSYVHQFDEIGIKVHDPKNGAWWEAQSHLQNSYEYNQWWKAFFSIEDVTATDAEALAEYLAQLFGFVWSR